MHFVRVKLFTKLPKRRRTRLQKLLKLKDDAKKGREFAKRWELTRVSGQLSHDESLNLYLIQWKIWAEFNSVFAGRRTRITESFRVSSQTRARGWTLSVPLDLGFHYCFLVLLESGKAWILFVTYTQSHICTRTATDIIPVFNSDRFFVFAK